MRIGLCVLFLCISCGSPQDQKKDSNGPNGQGPENGERLVNDGSDLLVVPCDTVVEEKCEGHTKGTLNELGYKQDNIKTVAKNFSLKTEEDIKLEFNDFENVNLSCKYRVDRDTSLFSGLDLTLIHGDVIQKIKAEDILTINAGVDYELNVSIENIFHCSDNWFRFSAIQH